MPLSAAERQRRYKEKLKSNPVKYEEYLKKKRENYHTKKRLIKDLTPKEKYNARIIWKLRKKNLRQKKKSLKKLIDMTPPSSPSILLPENAISPQPIDEDTDTIANLHNNKATPKSIRGKQKIRRDRSKLYRENLRLQKENEELKRKYEKYRKRCQRNKTETKLINKSDDTKKYKKLSSAIKKSYQETKKHEEKKIIRKIFESIENTDKREIIKESLGLSSQIKHNLKVKAVTTKLKKTLETFFQRVDISRPTAGKKETVTRHGQKMQKRFLLDTMKNLYKTFKIEYPSVKCSYYYFTKNKPFYVVKPSVSGREMCLCKTHTNPTYKASALKNKGVIDCENMSELIAATVCNPKKQACMYGTCSICCDLKILSAANKHNDKIQWKEWGRKQEEYEKNGKTLKVFKNIKYDKEGTVKELMDIFNVELKILKKHVYNIKIQFHNFRLAIDNLQNTEAVVVADFSENYSCKHHEEIQAHHFGGSRLQVSLHTVVVYVLAESTRKVLSYCTVSSITNHQPSAIWAHLDPVLKDIKSSYPDISTIHFFSDGPFSQYRQKQNFYLASTTLFDYGFNAMTWSFFEAGHGKGPADGVGGYLKRSADELVARGEDVSCAEKFYNVMKDVSKIKLYLISAKNIEDVTKLLPPKLQPLPGTKNVHQIFSNNRGELKYRHLSCFCSRGFCNCLSPKAYSPLPPAADAMKTIPEPGEEHNAGHEPQLVVSTDKICSDVKVTPSVEHTTVSLDSPLSNYISREKSPSHKIELLKLSQARNKSLYELIYKTPETSDEEQVAATPKPSTSTNDKENDIQLGDFLLVNVYATKGKIFKYVCVVDDLHEDGEIRVTFLRSVNAKNTFRLIEKDVADIDYTDIIEVLDKPQIKNKRGVNYFIFHYDVHVLEK